MGLMNACELIDAIKGRLITGRTETVFTGVSIDSRSVRKADLFIAIVGKRFDGHDFVLDAWRKGAAGAVVSSDCGLRIADWGLGTGNCGLRIADCGLEIADCGLAKNAAAHSGFGKREAAGGFVLVMVKDTTEALQNLAAWHRRRFSCPVAAVTGSNGKTTTKDLTWAILSRRYKTVRARGSKNNHIGLPLTLLELDEETEAAVVELGTSGFGEIRDLVSISSPDVGCITNIGPAHLEFFGSVENVAKAKAELLQGMREGCPLALNADDEWFDWLRRRAKGPVVSFGIHRPADFMAEEICARDGAVSFELVAELLGVRRRVEMPFPGGHNAYNALAAAAISSQLGAGMSEIEEGLRVATLPSMRYEVMTLSGVTVINDAYNANPASTMCSLASFCEMSVPGRRIFVCGDMLELGRHAAEAHRRLGGFIKSKPIDYVVAFGEESRAVVEAAFPGGHHDESSACCRSVEEVVSVLREVAVPGDAILIKGSRANRMERIVDALKTEHSLEGSAARLCI